MTRDFFKALYTLLLPVIVVVWLMQGSIRAYWQETYHQELSLFDADNPIWTSGDKLQTALGEQQQAIVADWEKFDTRSIATVNQIWLAQEPVAQPSAASVAQEQVVQSSTPYTPSTTSVVSHVAAPEIAVKSVRHDAMDAAMTKAVFLPNNTLPPMKRPDVAASPRVGNALLPGDAVFFVGDSLMQGVAPHTRRTLSSKYKIDSIDLSKQSTGLAYTSFFDWPGTVDKTLSENAQIKLVVIFLGPNDPWDFPVARGKPYLRFASAEWEEEYRRRIRTIIAAAQRSQAKVMWLEVPAMKKKKLNRDMEYLNTLYASEAERSGIQFIKTNELLGSDQFEFSAYAHVNGKEVKVRVDDGIHFTTAGQKILAEMILSHIEIGSSE